MQCDFYQSSDGTNWWRSFSSCWRIESVISWLRDNHLCPFSVNKPFVVRFHCFFSLRPGTEEWSAQVPAAGGPGARPLPGNAGLRGRREGKWRWSHWTVHSGCRAVYQHSRSFVITLSETVTNFDWIFTHIIHWCLRILFLLLCLHQSNETSDQALQTKLKQLARQALDRYISLKVDTVVLLKLWMSTGQSFVAFSLCWDAVTSPVQFKCCVEAFWNGRFVLESPYFLFFCSVFCSFVLQLLFCSRLQILTLY